MSIIQVFFRLCSIVVLLLFTAMQSLAQPPEDFRNGQSGISSSLSFCLKQATLNSSGQPVESSGQDFSLNASQGQELTIGCSSSNHYVLQSGFWGSYGSTLVPVILTVTRDVGDPELPMLDWSGNNAPYTIYRSSDCTMIFEGYLDSTEEQVYLDESPPADNLIFYKVMATAPGRSMDIFSPEQNGSTSSPDTNYPKIR